MNLQKMKTFYISERKGEWKEHLNAGIFYESAVDCTQAGAGLFNRIHVHSTRSRKLQLKRRHPLQRSMHKPIFYLLRSALRYAP
jgi:hypothetical protein